jgi:Dolichyl-phosphate-mannose-protein mannosyltransferase
MAGYLILLGLAVAAQSVTHAYQSDLSWSDEGSHYVSGLMIHDYIAGKFPSDPLTYATQYYIHFPRVGIGHWPPLYYALEAVVFLAVGPSIKAALLLEAAFAAAVAVTVGVVVGRLGGRVAAWAASITTLAAPEILLGTQGVMLDVPIAFMALLAMLAWALFLFEERWVWSVAFALSAVAAILIKGNGICLAMVPPLSVALTNRWQLLRNWLFWLPAPIAAALTGPWYWITYKLSANGFDYAWGIAYVIQAAPAYSRLLASQIGIPGLLLAAIGGFGSLRSRQSDWRGALSASALGLVLAALFFHSVVPAAIDGRYVTAVVPALVILAYLGIERLFVFRSPAVQMLSTVFCFLAIFATETSFHYKATHAMNAIAKAIFGAPHGNPFVLVGSTPGGEGAFTAEAATWDRALSTYVVRGFQVLGTGDFNGTDYTPRFTSADQMADWIRAHGIGWIVIDLSPQSLSWKHNEQLRQIAENTKHGWDLVDRVPNSFGETAVYRVPNPIRQPIDQAGLISELAPRKGFGR